MKPLFYLLLLTIVTWQRDADACSCISAHPQRHFCKSDYVLKVRIRSKETLNNDVVHQTPYLMSYAVKVQKIYKLSNYKGNVTEIRTPSSSAMCGLPDFTVNEKYLVTGRFLNGKAHINLCNYWVKWSELSVLEKKTIKKYKNYCNHGCQIEQCWNHNGCQPASGACYVPKWHYASDCYDRHGICTQRKNGKCRWMENNAFRTCSRKRKEEYYREP
ncbi:metalloproteinase inhibitor 4-like [Tubulanus polymorphus]|uniref:metalloproteinase inhibitor 4-like n=1 Tax=Tubulanus polymorphus TaxID=672921 RepID=UPI003DA2677A